MTRTSPRALIVEDEAVIALDLEECVESSGLQVAGVFGSCEEAEAWLSSHACDVAILDLRLRDGSCAHIAYDLISRGVPVIITTALVDVPDELEQAIRIPKPFDRSSLKRALRHVFSDSELYRRKAALQPHGRLSSSASRPPGRA